MVLYYLQKLPSAVPQGIEIIDVRAFLQRIASEARIFPASVHTVRASLGALGNPLGEEQKKRADWAQGLCVKTFTAGME